VDNGDSRPLSGLRVVEIGAELTEYCGLLLAGLGAEVVKVEPDGGCSTRGFPPFADSADGSQFSLHHYFYNRLKTVMTLPPEPAASQERLRAAVSAADVVLEGHDRDFWSRQGMAFEDLVSGLDQSIVARISPFGDTGPWAGYKSSDLVHLALGGPVMNCGYDPRLDGTYETAPIAPQSQHAYHIAGEQLAIGIVNALSARRHLGVGQSLTCSVHEAVAKATEIDLMLWVLRRQPVYRQTCRHAREQVSAVPTIGKTKDGRWIMTMGGPRSGNSAALAGLGAELGVTIPARTAEAANDVGGRVIPGISADSERESRLLELSHRIVNKFVYDEAPWQQAQSAGLMWAPLRKPHESALDAHWIKRGTVETVLDPVTGRSLALPVSKWRSTLYDWRSESAGHGAVATDPRSVAPVAQVGPERGPDPVALQQALSRWGRPFALQNVRILDFSWFLASAGGTRFLAAYGAEVIKVEWSERPDTRLGCPAPAGGRAARVAATGPLPPETGPPDADTGGQFNNKNTGKIGISLNVKTPEGRELAQELAKLSDVVAEGFSPGVMDRLGLGYNSLRALKPDIIYAQQSGMGSYGDYGRLRAIGPIAAAMAGTSEMSGAPDPYPPAGWGYSYLDWMGAYNFALAISAALYQRDSTGQGQYIDASQCEAGIFLTGVPMLDWSANSRVWQRSGNRHPYLRHVPYGIYPTQGDDRWIGISVASEGEWLALCSVLGAGLRHREAFATMDLRYENVDLLDAAMADATAAWDGYELMAALQGVGVAAGVCQTAEDRCDHDPQLAHLQWLTEVSGTKIGEWPLPAVPVKLDRTPAHIGGLKDRGAPCYGEDNEYVYGELLGLSSAEIGRLAARKVI
jgi:crotonobetainyl-CoA:carnitine CoA-transferase CaiB-like acyl-CoA transferase